MANWFGKSRRGVIFGLWNTNTSMGNIIGSLISGIWVSGAWGYSFVATGLILCAGGALVYLFMVVHPQDVGLPPPDHVGSPAPNSIGTEASNETLSGDTLNEVIELESVSSLTTVKPSPVTLWRALLIPGVVEYSLCLFFCKGVFYAFFGWLPVYIKDSMDMENEMAADISVVFDGGWLWVIVMFVD